MNILVIIFFFAAQIASASHREEAVKLIKDFSNYSSTFDKVNVISKKFLGLPYGKNGPLGEGEDGAFDQDPLYRFDTFDCTTYVETVVALALSENINEFEDHQNQIRYENGEIDYLKRNHFTDLQWIPFNIQNGYFTEITHTVVSPSNLKVAQALINFPGWLQSIRTDQLVIPMASESEKKKLIEELKYLSTQYRPQIAKVPYIEINNILLNEKILKKIPSPSIVNFVRPNWDLTETSGTHQNISHQGFLFRKKNVLFLRHASTAGSVQEVSFIEYLKKFKNHPTLKGIHLMGINPR